MAKKKSAQKTKKKVAKKTAGQAKKKVAKKTARPAKKKVTRRASAQKPATKPSAQNQAPGLGFDKSVFIHPAATVMGQATIGACSSIWPGAVVRADLNTIELGAYVNVQDNSTLHVDSRGALTIGDYTLIGHNAMVHSCTIGRGVLIGIGAVVLDGAEIGDGAAITAGCLIRGGRKIPAGALVLSKRGEVVVIEGKARPKMTVAGSLEYHQLAERHLRGQYGPFSAEAEQAFYAEADRIVASWK